MKNVIFSAVLIGVCLGAKLPDSFERCDRKAADGEKCLIGAAQRVIQKATKSFPEVGMPVLDPLDVPELTVGAGGGTVNVQQNYKNVQVHGFSKLEVNRVKFDFDKHTLSLGATFPELKMTADYDLNGKVLLLPIVGTGPSTLTLTKVTASIDMPFTEYEKKGKKYIKFVGNKVSLSPEQVTFNFENLFNGDKTLGDNINKVLNENWKEVFEDVRQGYEDAYGLIIQKLSEGLFSRVPLSEVFLNEA